MEWITSLMRCHYRNCVRCTRRGIFGSSTMSTYEPSTSQCDSRLIILTTPLSILFDDKTLINAPEPAIKIRSRTCELYSYRCGFVWRFLSLPSGADVPDLLWTDYIQCWICTSFSSWRKPGGRCVGALGQCKEINGFHVLGGVTLRKTDFFRFVARMDLIKNERLSGVYRALSNHGVCLINIASLARPF